MSKKLLMNNYRENGIEWDINLKSDIPISVLELCSEYVEGRDIKLNKYSNNQVLEVDIEKIFPIINEPRIQLLSKSNFGGQIYWDKDSFTIANTGSYSVPFYPPCTVKVALIDNVFYVYVNDLLIKETSAYSSSNLFLNGVKLQTNPADMIVTGFRYKNFELEE